jgi:glycosyltransferase involved in cell wall biosynthesis
MQDEGRGLYKTKNEEKLLNEATDIISNSIAGKEFIEENYNINGKNIILYNNPTPIPDKTSLKLEWRQKLNIDTKTILVSMFANITRFKDHFTLFKAWKLVLNHFEPKGQKLKLILAGACRETTNELKILGFDLNIAHSVIFAGSVLEVNELMHESDLVVHSSNTEGCPNAVCEAMALEKPVVGTDIPGCREALTDKYENSTLTVPNDPEDLAQKIIGMLEDKQKAKEIAFFNKQHIATEYTLENMIEKLFPLFVRALDK